MPVSRQIFSMPKTYCAVGTVEVELLKYMLMGLQYRSRKKTGKNSWINVSGSGASMSTKVGPVTFNSRGGMWVNLPGGFNFRGRWR